MLMLSGKVRGFAGNVIGFTCYTKLVPYEWDRAKFRLIETKSLIKLAIFDFHFYFTLTMFSFAVFRLLSKIKDDDMPERIRMMNILWIYGYGLVLICFRQIRTKTHEIRTFANMVFETIEKTGKEKDVSPQSTKFQKHIATNVILYLYVMLLNPPSHAVMVIDSPCAPNFISSLIFPCQEYLDNALTSVISFWINLLFFPFEVYIVSIMFFVWAFNFLISVYAMAWLKNKLENLRAKQTERKFQSSSTQKQCIKIEDQYRNLQLYVKLFNDTFRIYMEWYPVILLSLVSFLIFGVIRYWGEDWRAYTMFPACGIRCFLEVTIPTSLAGSSNLVAGKLLASWRGTSKKGEVLKSVQSSTDDNSKWLLAFQRSAPSLSIKAGSLYELENTIVLTYLDNCVNLTVTLLLLPKGLF